MSVLSLIEIDNRIRAMRHAQKEALDKGDLYSYDAAGHEIDTLLERRLPQQRCEHGNIGFP